jgi:hypothetical protein
MKIRRVSEVALGLMMFCFGLIGVVLGLILSMTIIGIVPGLFVITGAGGLLGVGFALIMGKRRNREELKDLLK